MAIGYDDGESAVRPLKVCRQPNRRPRSFQLQTSTLRYRRRTGRAGTGRTWTRRAGRNGSRRRCIAAGATRTTRTRGTVVGRKIKATSVFRIGNRRQRALCRKRALGNFSQCWALKLFGKTRVIRLSFAVSVAPSPERVLVWVVVVIVLMIRRVRDHIVVPISRVRRRRLVVVTSVAVRPMMLPGSVILPGRMVIPESRHTGGQERQRSDHGSPNQASFAIHDCSLQRLENRSVRPAGRRASIQAGGTQWLSMPGCRRYFSGSGRPGPLSVPGFGRFLTGSMDRPSFDSGIGGIFPASGKAFSGISLRLFLRSCCARSEYW
jgi:hypothetical protein